MWGSILIIYLFALNIISFITMKYDKSQAKHKLRRISERTLFYLAIVGGSLGIYYGMIRFRHKTRHISFRFGIPLLMLLQVVLVYVISTRMAILFH